MWTGFLVLRLYLLPPQPVANQPQDGKPAANKDGKEGIARKEAPAAEDLVRRPEVEPAKPQIAAPAASSAPRQYFTLGSADPETGYSALYYFDNQGAAVKCVELNGKRYKSVEELSGYLGRLELSNALGGGAEVNVVGRGTPAALATASGNVPPGLVVGDVIQKIDGQPVSDRASLEEYLREKKRPGQSATLSVRRKEGGSPAHRVQRRAHALAAGRRAAGAAALSIAWRRVARAVAG